MRFRMGFLAIAVLAAAGLLPPEVGGSLEGPRFVGVLVGGDGIVRCAFVYETEIGRDVRINVREFCEAHEALVLEMTSLARNWLAEHPIPDPIGAEKLQEAERLLRQCQEPK